MSVTDDERRRATALWQELGKPEAAYPTPEQFLAFMRQCPDAAGLDLAARVIEWAERSSHCWIADHAGLLDELNRTRASLADARRVVDAVNTWLGDDLAGPL